jgi:hypothetical protein
VVTGEQGKRPIPRVWSAATGAELCALTSHGRSVHQGAAVALDFSPDSRRCVTIGQGPMYTMAVWANTHADGAWTSCDLQVRGGRGGHAIVIIIQVCYHGTCNGYL